MFTSQGPDDDVVLATPIEHLGTRYFEAFPYKGSLGDSFTLWDREKR